MYSLRLVLLGFILAFLLGCSTINSQSTLYQKLGGESGLNTIVNQLVKNIGADKQIFHYFAKSNVTRFSNNLKQHLCAISDGPCIYNGDSMQLIHDGMAISERDFNHLVDLLIDAMNKSDISHTTQNQLLARLAPLRKDIIYR